MDTVSAFMRAEEAREAGAKEKVFDWEKAAALIRDRKPFCAEAGLLEDWEWTGDVIYQDGRVVYDDNTYLASIWATPVLRISNEMLECWRYKEDTPGWDASTKWPASALAILVV